VLRLARGEGKHQHDGYDDRRRSGDGGEDAQPPALTRPLDLAAPLLAAPRLRDARLIAPLADPWDEELARDLVEVDVAAVLATDELGVACPPTSPSD
jgi:hypothetical protein